MNCIQKMGRRKKWLLAALLAVVTAAVPGCQTIGYYSQAAKGQYQILAHQKRIDKLIADPQTPPQHVVARDAQVLSIVWPVMYVGSGRCD